MLNIKQKNFMYSLKVCKNKEGIRLFNICKYCIVANTIKRKRCIKCMRKLI